MNKKRLLVAAVLNMFIFLSTTGIVISYFLGNDGEYHILPLQRFWLFTTDSNILCALSALTAAVFELMLVTGRIRTIPLAVTIFKYIGTVAVLVTFTVVMCFLGPTMGYMDMLFVGTSIYMHLAGPVLAFIVFALLEKGEFMKKRFIPIGTVSVIIYGIVYVTMVVLIGEQNGGWMDFYGFNIGGFWYLSFAAIALAAAVISAVLRLAYNFRIKK